MKNKQEGSGPKGVLGLPWSIRASGKSGRVPGFWYRLDIDTGYLSSWKALMAESALGAMFEVLVDGVPRSYRDTRLGAMGAAQFLKSQSPNSEVAVRDMQTGEVTVVALKPG